MSCNDEGSVTRWLADLKAGRNAAVQPLWERYFSRVVELARLRMRSSQYKDAGSDEEDAALSAFDSLCAGLARAGTLTSLIATTSGGCWLSSRPGKSRPRLAASSD